MLPLILRADASTAIGAGHVTRCLALAQAWKRAGGRAIFAGSVGAGLRAWIAENCEFEAVDNEAAFISLLARFSRSPVVMDGYRFNGEHYGSIRAAGHWLLVIDDSVRLPHYDADVILNQNIGAEELHYAALPDTKLLLGLRYALLREEFVAFRDWERETPPHARRVLVTMGGADPDNVTLAAVTALRELARSDLEARIIVGPENPHQDQLAAAVDGAPGLQLVRFTRNMPELMAWAEVAISAAGSTMWELCCMMVPMLIVTLADNQAPAAARLVARGIATPLGWGNELRAEDAAAALTDLLDDDARRAAMARAGRTLVDGRGADRVAEALRS